MCNLMVSMLGTVLVACYDSSGFAIDTAASTIGRGLGLRLAVWLLLHQARGQPVSVIVDSFDPAEMLLACVLADHGATVKLVDARFTCWQTEKHI